MPDLVCATTRFHEPHGGCPGRSPRRTHGWNGTATERFARFVSDEDDLGRDTGCIHWIGGLDRGGYGQFSAGGRTVQAHRWAWEKAHGPVPDGMQLDHLCRNRQCVNVEHLEPVTPRENSLRGIGPAAINARKTHCVNGHPLEGENLRIDYQGFRRCIACQSARSKRHHARTKIDALTKGDA